MLKISSWEDYECIDAGNAEKLERWNDIILRRPDPQAIWPSSNKWDKMDAWYHRSNKGGGYWEYNKKLPEYWTVQYKDLTFKVSPTNFKHTGLFPEQACNWDLIMDKIKKSDRPLKVLNLFAYTGAASMAAAYAGADEVVHVDASKGMVEWAKENMKLSHLEDKKIRFIVDDCLKFVEREIRRGRKYEIIIMDPPSYGRGPNKELWKFEENIYYLINRCLELFSEKPVLLLINSYTTGISNIVLDNILKTTMLKKYPHGKIETGQLGLSITTNNLVLPCGIYGRWEIDE